MATRILKPAEPQTGPLVWLAIVGTTCLLLAALQKVLWLTVPFLMGLMLYYLLQPIMRSLLFRGVRRETAAGLVMGISFPTTHTASNYRYEFAGNQAN